MFGITIGVVLQQEVSLAVGLGLGLLNIGATQMCIWALRETAVQFNSEGMFRFSRPVLRWKDVQNATFSRDALILAVKHHQGTMQRVRVPLGQFKDREAVLISIHRWLPGQTGLSKTPSSLEEKSD